LIRPPSVDLAPGKSAAVYPPEGDVASAGGQPFDLRGQLQVHLGDRVRVPGVQPDPNPVVVVLDVGMVIQPFTGFHQALEEGDGLREAVEPEPLVDLAALSLPARKARQPPVDLVVGQGLPGRRGYLST
jgi:hypothetical protein